MSLTQKFLQIWFQPPAARRRSILPAEIRSSTWSSVIVFPSFSFCIQRLLLFPRTNRSSWVNPLTSWIVQVKNIACAHGQISPLLGFMTIQAVAVTLLPVVVCHSLMYFCTIFWIFTSMVETMVLPPLPASPRPPGWSLVQVSVLPSVHPKAAVIVLLNPPVPTLPSLLVNPITLQARNYRDRSFIFIFKPDPLTRFFPPPRPCSHNRLCSYPLPAAQRQSSGHR